MEDREKNSKKTEKKFLLFKEKVYLEPKPNGRPNNSRCNS